MTTRWGKLRGLFGAALLVAAVAACSDDSGTVDETDTTEADGTEGPDPAELQEELDRLQADFDELQTQSDTLATERDDVQAQLGVAEAAQEALVAQLDEATERAEAAEDLIAAFGEEFPIAISTAITDFDPIGRYAMTFEEAYCSGLPTCGQVRPAVEAQITQGPNGLMLTVPEMFSAGLLRVNGQLIAATDSDTMASCEGISRVLRVTTTVFGAEISVAKDGGRDLSRIGASVFVSAQPQDVCEGINALWGASFTPID